MPLKCMYNLVVGVMSFRPVSQNIFLYIFSMLFCTCLHIKSTSFENFCSEYKFLRHLHPTGTPPLPATICNFICWQLFLSTLCNLSVIYYSNSYNNVFIQFLGYKSLYIDTKINSLHHLPAEIWSFSEMRETLLFGVGGDFYSEKNSLVE